VESILFDEVPLINIADGWIRKERVNRSTLKLSVKEWSKAAISLEGWSKMTLKISVLGTWFYF